MYSLGYRKPVTSKASGTPLGQQPERVGKGEGTKALAEVVGLITDEVPLLEPFGAGGCTTDPPDFSQAEGKGCM